jgi:integrase
LGFRDEVGKKDFHSFRHTLADHLKQKGVAESLVGGLLGHQAGGITFNRYGKDFRPEVLARIVEMLELESF